MLSDYFKDTMSLSRAVVTGNKTLYEFLDTYAAHIQPADDAFSGGTAGRTGKTYLMFSTAEVRIGDRLVDQNLQKYEVYGVKKHKFRSRSHYESSLRSI